MFDRAREALEPSDAQVEAWLRSLPDATWLELFDAADALTDEDRDVARPVYPDRVRRLYRSLPGASVDWMKWMRGNPLVSDPSMLAGAPVADAARLATVYVRGERFNDGVFGRAVQDGSVDAVVRRLRVWVRQGGC
ncbi:DUF6508 domain-containing protein [Nocardioides sp. NPDC101246]|uniref:DUF6508 domain-containing protein n=1 Tax=Nocardioides sp. NPDC101246 TaxID=3364336 RepID=UPI0038059DDB